MRSFFDIPLIISRTYRILPKGAAYGTLRVTALDTRINNQIRATEVRVIGPNAENYGVLPIAEALKLAEEADMDLIEISPLANPPVAKIMEYGKFQYEQTKKRREMKTGSHATETKSVQVKIGTGENDLMLKARRAAQWLEEKHRVKVDLFLWGRYKYMEFEFLKERLERFLKQIPHEFKLAEPIAKSPKGLSTVLERTGKPAAPQTNAPASDKKV